ncbi:unnamed protein product [Staurois parvus]|uniref:Uncharacterized protein n=1 Tax=Staurois parvus TaxID=386267 RepID=A0ABN9D7X7_9NEOB|nr:unnamed protein product [Staurois parvus]
MNAAARLIHLTNHFVSATPLCQSLHWPPLSVLHPSLSIFHWLLLSVLHPSLPIPPLASTQCPPSLFANPSLHLVSSISLCQSLHWPPVSSIPLCQFLHWPPLSVLHPLQSLH